MCELKKGDVVMLKSGGPAMTLNFIFSEDRANCIWFENNEVVVKDFFCHVLKLVETV